VQTQPQAQTNYTYALIEPEQPKQVVVTPAPAPVPVQAPAQQVWYPDFEVSAPIPQPVNTKPVRLQAARPQQQPDLNALPKRELIKLLLAQLSKNDLESQ